MKRSKRVFVWSGIVAIALNAAVADGLRLETRWNLLPGQRSYLTTGTEQRGLSYNPTTDHLILVNRSGAISVHVLDAQTGDEIGALNTSIVSGGTFALSKVAVADDGAIYAANFGTIGSATPTFNIYRWLFEFDDQPVRVYASDPGSGNIQQWGTTFDVRGAGLDTQILISSSGGTIAAILTTTDGINFISTLLSTDVLPGQMGIAVAFGTNNTFWAKSVNGPLLHLGFDLATGIATNLHSYDVTNFPGTVGPIGVDAGNALLGAINVTTPDTANLYSISNLAARPALLSHTNLPSDNANSLFMGAVDFGPNAMFALDSNNGLVACNLVPSTDPVAPSIILHPAERTVFAGSSVAMVSSAAGTEPLSYQWRTNGVDVPNATNSTYSITNVQSSHEALYSVVVSNVAGVTTSFDAQLIVLPPGVLTPLWSLPPGSRTYLTATANNQRGLAYNPVTKHLILVNRAGALSVNVIDALTGTNVGVMSTNGISGGTFFLSKIEVADDGAIYGANFGTIGSATPTINIYRWANESAEPTLAFQGDPANGAGIQQYGNSFTLRGGGTNTQILLPTQRDVVALLTTSDGTNFTSQLITGVPLGGFYQGVVFGEGDTFWGKTNGLPLVQVGFDRATGASTLLQSHDPSVFPGSIGPIAIDPAHDLLAGIFIGTPDTINLYDISDPAVPPVLVQAVRTPTDNANTLFQGAIDFGDGMLFALDTNNGLAAYVLPFLRINRVGGNVVVSWVATLTGFRLEATTNMSSGTWTPVSGVVTVDGQNVVTLTAPTGNRFFRLVK